ncbi:MAG: hypothetical protein ACI4Q3_02340 [Kiritimatiellia bacterium]
MAACAKLAFVDGVLASSSPHLPLRTWARPAELAQARLACEPPPAALDLPDGAALLEAAFAVLPFAAPPCPALRFGPAVTPAARAAFALFAGSHAGADDFAVLRGAPGDFLVCAERTRSVWRVAGFAVAATTLTVRVEDLWTRTPPALRSLAYRMGVRRDPHEKDAAAAAGVVVQRLDGLAPDARVCLDVAANGGFLLTLEPEDGNRHD